MSTNNVSQQQAQQQQQQQAAATQQQTQQQQTNQQAQQAQQQANQQQNQQTQQSQQQQQQQQTTITIPGTNIQIPTSVAAANGIISANNIKLDGSGIFDQNIEHSPHSLSHFASILWTINLALIWAILN